MRTVKQSVVLKKKYLGRESVSVFPEGCNEGVSNSI